MNCFGAIILGITLVFVVERRKKISAFWATSMNEIATHMLDCCPEENTVLKRRDEDEENGP